MKLTGWSRKVTGHGVVYYVRRGSAETRYGNSEAGRSGNHLSLTSVILYNSIQPSLTQKLTPIIKINRRRFLCLIV